MTSASPRVSTTDRVATGGEARGPGDTGHPSTPLAVVTSGSAAEEFGVKDDLTPKRAGRVVETPEYVAFARRILKALGRRLAVGDVEARCPSCRGAVIPPMTPSLAALDLSDLGTRIGDRTKPLAPATMARAERCRQRFAEFPAVLMPAKSAHGTEKHPWQPLATQTSQRETAILSTLAAHRHNGDGKHITQPMDTLTTTHEKAVLLAVNNFQGAPRGVNEPLPTQAASETLSLLSSGVVPFRKNTVPTSHDQPMPTVTSEQIPGVLTAAGLIKNNGSIDEAKYRTHPLSAPIGTVVGSAVTQGVLFSGWYKQNGSQGSETAPHPLTDPLGTLTSRDTTALLSAEWHAMLADLTLDDCYFRMMGAHEIGRGSGFDVDFAGHQGTFIVWGSARKQTDGFGNAVSPPVGEWINTRLRAALHRDVAA